MGMLMLETCWG